MLWTIVNGRNEFRILDNVHNDREREGVLLAHPYCSG